MCRFQCSASRRHSQWRLRKMVRSSVASARSAAALVFKLPWLGLGLIDVDLGSHPWPYIRVAAAAKQPHNPHICQALVCLPCTKLDANVFFLIDSIYLSTCLLLRNPSRSTIEFTRNPLD
jgi:hypothetical protein